MIISVTQAPVPTTGKASDVSTRNSQKQNGGVDDGKEPPQVAPAVSPQNAGSRDDESKPQAASSEYDHPAVNVTDSTPVPESWPWHEKVAWFANLILAGVGIFGVFAAICTLKWIRHQSLSARIGAKAALRQAKSAEGAAIAAKDGAKAAFLNAQAVINVERPWLLESISRSKYSDRIWSVSIRNAGNTPAKIVDGYWCLSKMSGDFKLPIDHDRYLLLLQSTVMVKEDSFKVEGPDMRVLHSDARGGFRESPSDREFKFLYFHGNVEYWDMFTDRSAPGVKPHVTQWCYVYNPQADEFNRAPCTYHDHT